jgi:hypothetical protein
MPLERFIPKSPDPFIRNSQDFEVAKFGHLNTIIEYVNTYVVTDSLQLAGTGPLTSTARYITDSLGNASSLAISSGNIGIGTTNPLGKLDVRTTDGFGSVQTYTNNDSSAPLRLFRANNGLIGINTFSSGGTIDSPSDRASLGSITRFTGNAYVDGAYRSLARMEYYLDAIPITGVAPCSIRFLTVDASSSTYSLNERMGITSDGNVQINDSIVNNRNAKLFIKGSGSTSATTSLLVQNSAGTNLLQVKDNGLLTSNVDNEGGAFSIDVDTSNQTTLKLKPFGNSFNAAYQAQIYNYYGNLVIKSAAYGNVTTELFGNGQYKITDNYAYPYLTVYGANVGGKSVFGRPVEIKGIGSTSATTSLLVQNSLGDNVLKVRDDGKTAFGNSGVDCTITGSVGSGNKFEFYAFNGYDIVDGFGNVLVTGLGNTIRLPRQVGIGFNTQNNVSAILQADSTTQGFLPPRMTTTQRTGIVSPAAGLIVYDTDTNKSYTYDGTAWQAHW